MRGLDSSMGALAHSQQAVDKLRTDAQQAQTQAQQANSPTAIAGETTKGSLSTMLDRPIKSLRSGAQAIGEFFGATPKQTDQKNFAGQPLTTEQQDLEDPNTTKTVAGSFGNMALDAASMIPMGKGLGMLGDAMKAPIKSVLSSYAERKAIKVAEKGLADSIEAVYSNPTGKTYKKAVGDIFSGNREVTPSSVFREQGLTPDQKTVNLGTRLKDLKLGGDSVKNTKTLTDNMGETESKLQSAFDKTTGDISYNADKPKLFETLNKVSTDAPEEFRIKDSQAMVDRVVAFANKVVNKADDDLRGIRTARTEFDAQAKREFPNAFLPDGGVDTKTPAGYAIQTARDAMNEHLYNTAPNGGEIQNLVGREADLYRAMKVSLDKASKGEGKKMIAQWLKNNPAKAEILKKVGLVTLGATGYRIIEH